MNILGPPRKPLVKILKVEDLKNDDIVARIKKELASNLTFGKTDSIVSQKTTENKSESFYLTPQASRVLSDKTTLNVISETIFIKHPQIKQEELVSEAPVEGTNADNEDTNADNESQAEVVEQQPPAAELDDVIIDCDATITQEDISELGTDSRIIIVQDEGRGVYSRKRREKFLKMTLADLPAKKEKIEKCYRPLEELPKPKDQLRCPTCGVLFNRSIFAKHEFLCPGKRKKSKFGCLNCSYTDYSMKELEAHIKKEHCKKKSA